MADEHIYTIPLWDAYRAEDECPFCALSAKLEQELLEASLGGGMMESDMRLKTNAEGFCARHLEKLYGMQSALPLALMLHTHMIDINEGMDPCLDALDAAIAAEEGTPLPRRALKNLKGGSGVKFAAESLAAAAQARSSTCYICSRLDHAMERYATVLTHMWKNEAPFREAFAKSRGLCMAHLPLVVQAASSLSGDTRRGFLRALSTLQRENFRRLQEELEWFTLKFDYRNADKPWGNSKDAVPRAMRKLRGT